ncbi:FeoB-associated Cys-rich membrane protein [Emergencia timonensis]|uniref:FeoB-associated Cys-rich membrane protein n=1 Tax=Emergencia timonensis TaxID=1776384 RepID=UPI0039963047
MGLIDILIVAVVAAALFFAVRFIRRSKGGCSGCNGCSGNCASCAYREEKGTDDEKR